MVGKLNLNFGVIGWCKQGNLAGDNSSFPAIGLKIFWWVFIEKFAYLGKVTVSVK